MDLIPQDVSYSATHNYVLRKVCTVCRVDKVRDEFHADKTVSDGRAGRCKECDRARTRLYAQRNREKVRDGVRRYRGDALHFGVDEKFGDKWQDLTEAFTQMRAHENTFSAS